MIARLRRRLTLLVIGVLIVVTALIVLSEHLVNRRNIAAAANAALEALSARDALQPPGGDFTPPTSGEGETPPEPPEGQTPALHGPRWLSEVQSGSEMMANLANHYVLWLDDDGTVTRWESARADLYTDDQMQSAADTILATGRASGRVGTQFFRLAEEGESRRLTVLDARLEYLSARRALGATALAASLACLALSVGACVLIRRMLRPVQDAFERQKQFVWDASHEFKTPLAVISANAEVLSGEIGDNEYLGYIRSEVERTDALVQSLLTLARMDKGAVTAELKRLDLSSAVLSVALPFESTVFEAGRTLEIDVPEGVFCKGDEAMLQQLTVILLSNALKYSDAGGRIALSLAARGRTCVLTVFNTGEGIAPDKLEKIFDRFYRADTSHNREIAGNGLGLAIARTIARAHRGDVRAESEPGRSATFVVNLPG